MLFVYPLLLMLDEFLYLMQWFFNAVFSMSRLFAHFNRLRWSSQVLALANESTYDSQRSYLCLFLVSLLVTITVMLEQKLEYAHKQNLLRIFYFVIRKSKFVSLELFSVPSSSLRIARLLSLWIPTDSFDNLYLNVYGKDEVCPTSLSSR